VMTAPIGAARSAPHQPEGAPNRWAR